MKRAAFFAENYTFNEAHVIKNKSINSKFLLISKKREKTVIPLIIYTPKVSNFWGVYFLWVKQDEKTKIAHQNSKFVL